MKKYFNVRNLALVTISGLLVTVTTVLIALNKKAKEKKLASHSELSKYNTALIGIMKRLKESKKELNKIISKYKSLHWDAKQDADFFGSRSTASITTTNGDYGTNSQAITHSKNTSYDPERAAKYRKQAEEYRELVQKYVKVKHDLDTAKKELEVLKSTLISLVKKSDISESEISSIESKLDELIAKVDEADEKIKSDKESADESSVIEYVYTSFINGFITESTFDEAMELLTE